MSKPREHSDYFNTDDAQQATTISGGVLVLEYWVDAQGYVLSRAPDRDVRCTIRNPAPDEIMGNESKATVIPFDRAEIVWPEDGWPVDEDGRGRSCLEVKGAAALVQEQRVLVQHIRQYLRKTYDLPNEVAA